MYPLERTRACNTDDFVVLSIHVTEADSQLSDSSTAD